jgi:hypothetical protein
MKVLRVRNTRSIVLHKPFMRLFLCINYITQ